MSSRPRSYGQFCGLARALEIVGERWSLLIVRDLVLGPKRYPELRAGLPKIPDSILSSRLNDLEQSGVLCRRIRPDLDASVIYELTEYGAELDQVLLELGLWGARALTRPRPDEVFTLDAAILSLYTTFQPDASVGLRMAFEIHYDTMVVHALVENDTLKVGEGGHPGADLVIRVERGTGLLDVLTGRLTPAEAVSGGEVRLEGDPGDFLVFSHLFRIPAGPDEPKGLTVR
jgi:DNA-binding HxlR family transcriptional regulator